MDIVLPEGYQLTSFATLDSTNDEAKRLAKTGADAGAVIVAETQTKGRGRMGREWVSEKGNLYLSILLRPDCDMNLLPQLSFVAAVAIREALKGILPVTFKWPNDLLAKDKKCAGILLESGEAGKWVVVGVGINTEHFPEEVAYPATSIKAQGVEASNPTLLERFLHYFDQQYRLWSEKGFEEVRRYWLSHASGLLEEITVQGVSEKQVGIFDSIDQAGNLVLKEENGNTHSIMAGDVLLRGTG